jgi:thiol:disulfide interchange protein
MKYFTLALILILPLSAKSQEPVKLYNPAADAKKDLALAVQTAKEQNKHVLVQVGGNWCSWCVKLHGFFESNTGIDSILKADYVLVRINYSPENKNPGILASLGYPQRFGFPVLLILDQNGQRLHTQDTGYLELDKGYDPEKVRRFLLGWNVAAVDTDNQ